MLNNTLFGKILLIMMLAFLFLFIYYAFFSSFCNGKENMISIPKLTNPTYSRSACNYKIGDTLKKVLDANDVKDVKSGGDVHFVCGYDEIENEIKNITPQPNQRIHIIHNADFVSAKDYLWNRLVVSSGLDRAKIMMPNTYVLSNENDRIRLVNDYKMGSLYIMKKNIQRQEGLQITDSLDEMLNANSSYVIAQELLQNPYTINVKKNEIPQGDRKINMRFYVLLVCKNNNMDVYVFNNGFMYYTNATWKKGTKDSKINITTGYLDDRWVYTENPLTHNDFKKYLDDPNRKLSTSEMNIIGQKLKLSDVIFSRIYQLLHDVMMSSIGKACDGDKLRDNITFQLFGADIAINDQLWPQIMELNKGPDLGAKDDRDGEVKRQCTKDMLRIIGVINDSSQPNGFINIISKDGEELKKVCF
jgi:hypothetical protein